MKRLSSESGATVVIVAIVSVMLLGFVALAVDFGHIYVVQNQLQNAADAGALAGAAELYYFDATDGTLSIQTAANDEAHSAAIAHFSDKLPVEVVYSGGGDNADDVQRGHWSFAGEMFTPNSLIQTYNGNFLVGKTTEELDQDTNFINAVRVRTRREQTPAMSFFARIFGYEGFIRHAEAVAYLGYAGSVKEEGVDLPIAVCQDSLIDDQDGSLQENPPRWSGDEFFTCTTGRLINSGPDPSTNETGGWTSFNQESTPPDFENPCTGGTNANEIKGLLTSGGTCTGTNPTPINFGEPVATLGGEAQAAFNQLRNCWVEATDVLPAGELDGVPDVAWGVTLPVVLCPSNNVGTCEEVVGIVEILLVWITQAGTGPSCDYAASTTTGEVTTYEGNYPPLDMTAQVSENETISYSCSHTKADFDALDPNNPADRETGQVWFDDCWDQFVDAFDLQNPDENGNPGPAPCQKKALYFLPSCDVHMPSGGTGGRNFGILAKIPVLVK